MQVDKIFYICNRKRPQCEGSNCGTVHNDCKHTTDKKYALYETHDKFEYYPELKQAWEIEKDE